MLAVTEGETMLEVGSGTGEALGELARAVGKTDRAVGVDISQRMLDRAAAHLGRVGLPERAELIRSKPPLGFWLTPQLVRSPTPRAR